MCAISAWPRFAPDLLLAILPSVICPCGQIRDCTSSRFFSRALRLAQKRSLSGPLDEWQQTRDEICNDIFTNFWSDRLQAFVQSKGREDLDASALLMPMMRFISPVDPMWLSTMRAMEERLIEDTLVRRYDVEQTHVDGLPVVKEVFHRILILVCRVPGPRGPIGKSA